MNDIFPQYRGKTLDNFEAVTPNLKEAVIAVQDYINDLGDMKDAGRGITFMGQNGVGKTHLACCVMSAAKGYQPRPTVRPYKIECIELSTYIKLWQELWRVSKSDYDEDQERAHYLGEQLRLIERVQFLLLDDLGREHASDSGWSNEQVFDLLRYRWNRRLPTLVTTNLQLPGLDRRYTEGMSSFLHEATVLVIMDGEDYRVANADASWTDRD